MILISRGKVSEKGILWKIISQGVMPVVRPQAHNVVVKGYLGLKESLSTVPVRVGSHTFETPLFRPLLLKRDHSQESTY